MKLLELKEIESEEIKKLKITDSKEMSKLK